MTITDEQVLEHAMSNDFDIYTSSVLHPPWALRRVDAEVHSCESNDWLDSKDGVRVGKYHMRHDDIETAKSEIEAEANL